MSQLQPSPFQNQEFLLFVQSSSGFMHNSIFESLPTCFEALQEFLVEEAIEEDEIRQFNITTLAIHFLENDFYKGYLTNNAWFHIQEVSPSNKAYLNQFVSSSAVSSG